MKKAIIITITLIYTNLMWAQTNISTTKPTRAERQYDKIIKNIDVLQYLNVNSEHNENIYWETLDNKHKVLLKYRKICSRNNYTAIKSKEYINKKLTECNSGELYLLDAPNVTNYLKNSICGNDSKYSISISIIHNESANAFVYPNGEIFLTDSLCLLLDLSAEKLIGICAHEMGHYIIQHAYIHQWKSDKYENKNKRAIL